MNNRIWTDANGTNLALTARGVGKIAAAEHPELTSAEAWERATRFAATDPALGVVGMNDLRNAWLAGFHEQLDEQDYEDDEDPEFDHDPYDDRDVDDDHDPRFFANRGSALRCASKDNPRNLPCPTCDRPNVLTPEDRARGYQCDSCADRAESGMGY